MCVCVCVCVCVCFVCVSVLIITSLLYLHASILSTNNIGVVWVIGTLVKPPSITVSRSCPPVVSVFGLIAGNSISAGCLKESSPKHKDKLESK